MKDFVNSVLSELTTNSKFKGNSLIRMVVESANKSINSGENYDKIYHELNESLRGVNRHLKNKNLDVILHQFSAQKKTIDSYISNLYKIGGLEKELISIKESTAYSNPIIMTKVENYLGSIKSGVAEFKLYPSFISDFGQHLHESSIKKSVNKISKVLENNPSGFEMLNSIYTMDQMNSPIYESVSKDLKDMLANRTYTPDIINLKYGTSNLPLITSLVENLKILESKKFGSFYLGNGNGETVVRNTIAPSRQVRGGMLIYLDDKFMKISESKLAAGEDRVHIKAGGFRISTVNPDWVKTTYPKFYSVCESYVKLGFMDYHVYEGVESSSLKDFKISFVPNFKRDLELRINGQQVKDAGSVNLNEALALYPTQARIDVKNILENQNLICNFEFIKNLKNDRNLSESFIFDLNGTKILCDKLNQVERKWSKANGNSLYEHCMTKFNYDISSIFESEINEASKLRKIAEKKKSEKLEDISKLEASKKKLEEAIGDEDTSTEAKKKLEKIKESIDVTISNLKEEYVKLDLIKFDILAEAKQKEKEKEEKEKKDKKKSGFPDFSGDGKVTKKDILMAKGIIKKKSSKKKLNEQVKIPVLDIVKGAGYLVDLANQQKMLDQLVLETQFLLENIQGKVIKRGEDAGDAEINAAYMESDSGELALKLETTGGDVSIYVVSHMTDPNDEKTLTTKITQYLPDPANIQESLLVDNNAENIYKILKSKFISMTSMEENMATVNTITNSLQKVIDKYSSEGIATNLKGEVNRDILAQASNSNLKPKDVTQISPYDKGTITTEPADNVAQIRK